jgi:shikimate dehydrogenase
VIANASTRLFAVLGDPVAHSLSPRIQNAAFTAAGCNAVYLALRCVTAELGPLMRLLAAAGGGGNITVPHKQHAARIVERASPVVHATGACNTFVLSDGELYGDNTDVAGFAAVARQLTGEADASRALVLGAGGAARAAVFSLLQQDAARITVVARTTAAVRALIDHLDPAGERVAGAAAADLPGQRFDLVVNATPLGLAERDPLPIDLATLAHAGAAFDMTYTHAGPTAWTRHASALGIPAAHGHDMLVEQGAASFELWTGRPAPRDVMRAALAGD